MQIRSVIKFHYALLDVRLHTPHSDSHSNSDQVTGSCPIRKITLLIFMHRAQLNKLNKSFGLPTTDDT